MSGSSLDLAVNISFCFNLAHIKSINPPLHSPPLHELVLSKKLMSIQLLPVDLNDQNINVFEAIKFLEIKDQEVRMSDGADFLAQLLSQ